MKKMKDCWCSRVRFVVVLSLLMCVATVRPDEIDFLDSLGGGYGFAELQDDVFPSGDDGIVNLPSFRDLPKPEEVVPFLCDPDGLNGCSLIEEDFYLRTNTINKRELVDLPVFEPVSCCYQEDHIFSVHLFINRMFRSELTKRSDALGCYLALCQDTLLEKIRELQKFLGTVGDFESIIELDPDKIFALFRNMTVQEHRAGFMFHYHRIWPAFEFRFLIPLYYDERHYWMSKKEQDCAERELANAFAVCGVQQTTKKQQEQFQDRYLISDKFGIGDLRIEFDGPISCLNLFAMNIGAMLTIPTAVAFKKGLKGSYFKRSCCQPRISLLEFAGILESKDSEEEKQQEATDMLEPFALGALERLSSILLETGLGNGGHFGIGPMVRFRTDIGDLAQRCRPLAKYSERLSRLVWKSRMSLEYLMPRNKKRCFVRCDNKQAFEERDFQSTDPVVAADNLLFLEEELVNKFYPVCYTVKVSPGLLFRSTNKLCYDGTCWDAYVGTDTWLRLRDKISEIQAPSEIRCKLDQERAKPFVAYQSKLFGGVVYHLERPKRDWYFSLNLDVTTFKRGMGRDGTLTVCVETNY